ncbi:MAG: hypothetical protein JWO06_1367 [Bacteroidota bacterium]|nr:hypothetical protein [Bacteroidota bacterium]
MITPIILGLALALMQIAEKIKADKTNPQIPWEAVKTEAPKPNGISG